MKERDKGRKQIAGTKEKESSNKMKIKELEKRGPSTEEGKRGREEKISKGEIEGQMERETNKEKGIERQRQR